MPELLSIYMQLGFLAGAVPCDLVPQRVGDSDFSGAAFTDDFGANRQEEHNEDHGNSRPDADKLSPVALGLLVHHKSLLFVTLPAWAIDGAAALLALFLFGLVTLILAGNVRPSLKKGSSFFVSATARGATGGKQGDSKSQKQFWHTFQNTLTRASVKGGKDGRKS